MAGHRLVGIQTNLHDVTLKPIELDELKTWVDI
jgi:hypothetical protein